MVIYKNISKYFLPALFFLTLALLLIAAWFKGGHFYGGGDVGLPTYNPIRIFEMSKYIWWQAIAPGFLIPHVITSTTLYFFLSFFQLLGIGPLGIQAILFFILLFFMGFGMYLLTLSIIGQDKKIYAIITGLFYLFNPYMMTQVWHRFVHTQFLFVASIPFLILFWRLWIKSGNYLHLLFFLLVNLAASYMFGTIAFIFPLWLILSLFTISEMFLPWENKSHFIKILWRSTLGLFFWILLNSWWLIPALSVSQGIASQQHNIWESIATLITISKQAILPYSLQMGNSFYLFDQAELGEVYKSFFFRLIPWLGVVMIFLGMVIAFRRKNLAGYALIYLIIISLAKGTSSPFGQPFLLIFSKSFALGLLRNPFEKIGILLPVAGGILFVIGIEGLFNWFSKKWGNLAGRVILVTLLVFMGVYYWPMYQGTIFGKVGQPSYVEVPSFYKDANRWLNDRLEQEHFKDDGKILHLPLTRSDVATFKWDYGYHGVESSSVLLTALPSISHGLNLHRIDDSLTALSLIFHDPYSKHKENILKLLQDFNVRFIVLHKDIEWRGIDLFDPEEVERVLDNLPYVEKKEQFGNLTIYEVLPEYFKSEITLSEVVNFVYPQTAIIRMWPNLITNVSSDIITPESREIDEIINQSHEKIVFPELSLTYLEASEQGMDTIINNLAVILYNLSNTKKILNKNGDVDAEQAVGQIISAGENLINSYVLLRQNAFVQANPLIEQYVKTIDKLFEKDLRNTKLITSVSTTTYNEIFKLHLLILEQMDKKLDSIQREEVNQAANKIRQDLNNYKLLPIYSLIKKDNLITQERQINEFNIPMDGKYELLMVNSSVSDIYPNKLEDLDIQINNESYSLKGTKKEELISYGEKDLNKGAYEISFNNLLSVNLFQSDRLTKKENVSLVDKDTFRLVSNGSDVSYIEGDLGVVSGEDTYQINLDGSFQSGVEFYVQIIQDTDEIVNGMQKPRVGTFIYRTKQDSSFQNYSFKLAPLNITTRKAKIRFLVDPIGTLSSNAPISPRTPTTIDVKNIKVSRILNNQIFLRAKTGKDNINSKSGEVYEIRQKNPTLYQGKIRIDRPTFLFFKEAFHPGWELELKNEKEVYKADKHYLGNLYGNAWWIGKTGEYSFKIEFKPQQKVTLGIYLGLSGLLGVFLLFLGSKIRKKYEHH